MIEDFFKFIDIDMGQIDAKLAGGDKSQKANWRQPL